MNSTVQNKQILFDTALINTDSIKPIVVDLNVFCDTDQSVLKQQTPASVFSSLYAYVKGFLQPIDWTVHGYNRELMGAVYDSTLETYHRFLHIKADTQVQIMCCRCLQMMTLPLKVDTVLQVFQTEQAADHAALYGDLENSLDPIVSSRQFDLIQQVQEELLLAIPENPVHKDINESGTMCIIPKNNRTESTSLFALHLAQQLNSYKSIHNENENNTYTLN